MSASQHRFFARVLAIAAVCLSSACTPNQVTRTKPVPSLTPNPSNTRVSTRVQTSTATVIPLPELTLGESDFYFTIDGRQSFLFSRNLGGYQPSQYIQLLQLTKIGGSQLVRIQLDSLGTGMTSNGNVDEAWAKNWEQVFDEAATRGILVLPVFTGWFDWNNGTPDYGYSTWNSNAFNAINGGPAMDPGELFQPDSVTQKMWLDWMKTLIERWQGRENIAAWEIFSEVNISTGVTEASGVAFMEQAADMIHRADPRQRPITASLADVGDWSRFYSSASLDFISIHPYPPSAELDTAVIANVRRMREKYNKPVMIGESGLSAATPDSEAGKLSVAENAQLGAKHAIWAAVVSGAMNGRSLYWEDGFGIYFPSLGLKYLQKYADLERPAAKFVSDVNFTVFQPLTSQASDKISGAAVGSEQMVIGWFRDRGCEPPHWPLQPVLSGQKVSVRVPGSALEWKIDFYSTATGELTASTTVAQSGNQVTIPLPDFTDDIAFKMYPQLGTATIEPTDTPDSSTATTDPIAGKWAGTIVGKNNSFSTTVEISIEPGCEPGRVCGKITAPLLACSGEIVLQEVQGQTFVFIEQNMAGAAACESGTYEYIELESNGTLSLNTVYTSPSGTESESSGTLTRQ
jgi:hypothetical protein